MDKPNADIKREELMRSLFVPDIESASAGKIVRMRREHALDGFERFDSTVTIRLWFKAGASIMAVVVSADGECDDRPFVASIAYAREDAATAINAPVIGLTLMIASPIIKSGRKIRVALLFNSMELLLTGDSCRSIKFDEFMSSVSYDFTRTGVNVESYTYTKAGEGLVSFLSGAWQLYLATEKQKYSVIEIGRDKPKYSIVTVFYRNTALASMYPMLTKVFELGHEFEVILCFQEASIFKSQIDWICFVAEQARANVKIVMFEENVGFSAANNVALDLSAGSVVMLLNPDIIADDSKVYGELMRLAAGNDALVGSTLLGTGGDIMHNGIDFETELSFDGKKPFKVTRTFHLDRHVLSKSIKKGKVIKARATTGALIAAKKSLWQKLSGLSERYVYAHFEDVDLCIRAEKLGIPCWIFQNTALTHIESFSSGEGGMSSTIKLVNSHLFNKTLEGVT